MNNIERRVANLEREHGNAQLLSITNLRAMSDDQLEAILASRGISTTTADLELSLERLAASDPLPWVPPMGSACPINLFDQQEIEMPSMRQRITTLESASRAATQLRVPGVTAETMSEIGKVALVCSSPDDLIKYLSSLEARPADRIVSLDERHQADAVRAGFARSVFDEVRAPSGGNSAA